MRFSTNFKVPTKKGAKIRQRIITPNHSFQIIFSRHHSSNEMNNHEMSEDVSNLAPFVARMRENQDKYAEKLSYF